MKKILFAAAIISIFNFQFSTSQAQDAVFKLLRYEWTLNADGTSDYHYRHEVQILRNRALTAYADKGETFVVYNPDLEELTVNEVYTVQKDGTRIEMPQNAFVYQLPSQCADCGRFNHLRELAMVHTGMELGCTIVVDYTIHRQYNLLYEYIPLMRECPVEKLEVKVNYPNGQKPEFTFSNGLLKVSERTNFVTPGEKQETFGYTYTNVEQAPQEPYMPAESICVMHIFNGAPEYTPAFDRNGLKEARVIAFQHEDGDTEIEQATDLRNYVVDNIHLNDIHPSHLGYTHASAAEVWQTGCGTATDKAVLLAAMLNETGYQARVTGDNMDEVGVIIDTLEYHLSVRSKKPAYLYGEAKDEVTKVTYNRSHNQYPMDTLGDGFYSLPLERIKEVPAINAGNLTSNRTAPLATSQCDISACDEYLLANGMRMVGDKVSLKVSFNGIGMAEISIKQSGKKIVVNRKLKIEKNIIEPADYANFRQLMATWQSIDRVLIQSK